MQNIQPLMIIGIILIIILIILVLFLIFRKNKSGTRLIPIPLFLSNKRETYQKTPRNYVELAKKYAPLAIFHKDQRWGPASVDYIFKHTNLQSMPETSCKKDKSCATAPKVNWLVSNQKLSSPSDILDWFYGPEPRRAGPQKAVPSSGRGPLPGPVYCFVAENSKGEIEWTGHPDARIVLFYCFLFAYNRGKDIPLINTVMGNHVGDIETCGVVLDKDEKPIRFLYGAHSYNFWNDWDNKASYCGEKDEMSDQGITKCPILEKFNSTTGLFSEDGTHPVVYLADDSHGTWISRKEHTYKKIKKLGIEWITLSDDTSKPGFQWETWKNIHVISKAYWSGKRNLPTPFPGIRNWFTQIQRWGNPEEGCLPLVGQCRQEDGPGGFNKGAVNWDKAEDEENPTNKISLSPDAKFLIDVYKKNLQGI